MQMQAVTAIDRTLLQQWPLPVPDEQSDKNTRGSILIIGGSPETPGALLLAAQAALRSGVGRLRLATSQSLALPIGIAIPEARVVGLAETPGGEIAPDAADQLADLANGVTAVLLGPGMLDQHALRALLERLPPQIKQPVLVLDAGALTAGVPMSTLGGTHAGRLIVTPHAGEMAQLVGCEKAEVTANPQDMARRVAGECGAVVVLKGPGTWIADPSGRQYSYTEGHVGLATSGSGDTLSGIVAGLAARKATPIQAAVWGVYLHGEAGNRLAQRCGRIGFLARELPHEIPHILSDFD
jgi:hydroxyethylthiazole kinase-like uncharacterized protein yjeF